MTQVQHKGLDRKPTTPVTGLGTTQTLPMTAEVAQRQAFGQAMQLKRDAEMAQNFPGGIPQRMNTLQRKPESHPQGLPPTVQPKMEAALNADLSSVRVHTNSAEAQKFGAQAFTQGDNVHFAPGKYDPQSQQGQELIGHEMAHVKQQRDGRVQATRQMKGMGVNEDSGLEREADELGKKAARGEVGSHASSVSSNESTQSPIQKKEVDLTSQRFRGEKKMEDALDGKQLLKEGDSGPHITRLQKALIAAGQKLPKYGADGTFGNETVAAVKAYQLAHGLSADGEVGPLTMASLDQYLRLEPGANPMPPKEGSVEDKLEDLLAKGDKMSDAEALRAKTLLFQLKNDEFRVVLKQMAIKGTLMALLKKLSLNQIMDSAKHISQEVVVPVTILKPAADTSDADFRRANQIYNPVGLEIEKGDKVTISEKTSKAILGGDNSLDEFTTTSATKEELDLIKRNRVKGRITAYWVSGMTSSRGEALLKSVLSNMAGDSTSVVVNEASKAQDTFPHELGHALGLPHHPNANHMMASGDIRNIIGPGIDKLGDTEIESIKKSTFIEFGQKGLGK